MSCLAGSMNVTLVPVDVDKEIIEGGRPELPGVGDDQTGWRVQKPPEGRDGRERRPHRDGALF
jgi:hypothetical protein